MKAIVLSAGKGTRMMPLTKDKPKCLLEISDGISVIESQLRELSQCPAITQVVFVLGYLSDQVEKKLASLPYKIDVQIIYNPFYDISNNLISLWMALPALDSDFVIINGDNVFNQNLLTALTADTREGFMIAVNAKDSYDAEDMKVVVKNGSIVRISKEIPVELADGEASGFHKVIGKRALELFQKTLRQAVRNPKSRNQFYLELFNQIAGENEKIHSLSVNKSDWAEIDFHPDLKLIREGYSQLIENFNSILPSFQKGK